MRGRKRYGWIFMIKILSLLKISVLWMKKTSLAEFGLRKKIRKTHV